MTSSAFVGVNDGWTDLKGSSNCGSSSCPDYTMDYTYSAANNGNTAQTGELYLADGGTINTQTATSITFDLVLSFGQANGGTSSTTSAEQALAGTLGDNFSTMLSTYVSQWNTFDITLNWGYNNWNGITGTVMTRTSNGAWTGFAMVPSSATQLNMAFYNQSGTWDNNNGSNYTLTVS